MSNPPSPAQVAEQRKMRKQQRDAVYRQKHREQIRAYKKRYYATEHGRELNNAKARRWQKTAKGKACVRRHTSAYTTRYPEKALARLVVRNALRTQQLTKPSACELCGRVSPKLSDGRSALHAHHHRGYHNPLLVQWLCVWCHKKAHDGLLKTSAN